MTDAIEIPILPSSRARALTILSEPEPEPEEIAEVVRSDPALAGAVLRASNSAWSAPRAPIDAIDRAIIRIGTRETMRVVGVAVLANTFTNLQSASIDPWEFCRHVVACALMTEVIVDPGSSRGVRAAAYTAGLLHDIGRLAMADADPLAYTRAVEATELGVDIREAERREFGYDHAEHGEQVAETWQVPDELVEPIGAHHGDDAAVPLAAAVRHARRISWSLGIGDGVYRRDDDHRPAEKTDGAAGELDKVSLRDDLLVYRLGGPEVLLARIQWLSSAVRTPPR